MSDKKKAQKKPASKLTLRRQKVRAAKGAKKLGVVPPPPEGLKKAWERENRVKALRAERVAAIKKKAPEKRAAQADRIEKYNAKYAEFEKRDIEATRQARLNGNFFKPADARVAIVIRIRGINRVSPKVRKVLQLFRLLQIHNAVFIRLNKATINMLKLVQPYVAYGYPSVETIRALIYKRGFAKIRSRPGAISRIPIMDNALVEKYLGKYKIETVEDMVFELFTGGKNFTKVSNFLWPFKLNSPRRGYRGRKRYHYNEGGSYGNWERHINTFVQRIL